jgi:hypothetical protein
MSNLSLARIARRSALALALVALGACASASRTTARTPGGTNVLTGTELATAQANNLYEAIDHLRPTYLRPRASGSAVRQEVPSSSRGGDAGGVPSGGAGSAVLSGVSPVMVYRDDVRLGGVDDMRTIAISEVAEVRFIPGPQAVVRFGTNHSSGAIMITSKR